MTDPTSGARGGATAATESFRAARDQLLARQGDYADYSDDADNADDADDAAYTATYESFAWPQLDEFNWALNWFDVIARDNDQLALWIVHEDGAEDKLTYAQLSARSHQVAAWLRTQGVRRGDRLLVMLGNRVALWETILAAIKLGAVIIPTATLMGRDDLTDRVRRGHVRHVVVGSADTVKFDEVPKGWTPIAVGDPVPGWLRYDDAYESLGTFAPDQPTDASEPLLLYFTSGTTAKPKLVEHTHASYPAGHLSTMYWIGCRPGDVHLNVASPGWAKHAWSNVFAPLNAGATVLILNQSQFSAARLLDTLVRCEVATFCAPPTVWRMLVQEDLTEWSRAGDGRERRGPVREALSAGEPLNAEVIEVVQRAWDITIRDGFGQTETTAQIGNPPGARVKPGSMGRALPGYRVTLIDPATDERGEEGEICLDLSPPPLGLMTGYRDDAEHTAEVMRHGFYHTGDVASRDSEGYVTYVGRTDDVFKSSDYRISPFELESVLIEHPAVAEAAVVPSPEPLRLSVPKAYVTLASGHTATGETAFSILRYAREHLSPYKRVRRLEFAELPKTLSGKIRRVELRGHEDGRHEPAAGARRDNEYWEEDFPDLEARDTGSPAQGRP